MVHRTVDTATSNLFDVGIVKVYKYTKGEVIMLKEYEKTQNNTITIIFNPQTLELNRQENFNQYKENYIKRWMKNAKKNNRLK